MNLYDQIWMAPATVFVQSHERLLRHHANVSLAFPGDGRYEIQFIQPGQTKFGAPLEEPGHRFGEQVFHSPWPDEKREKPS